MFIFKRYYVSEEKVANSLTSEEEESVDMNYMIDSKYVIIIDGEPVGFTNNKEESMEKVKNIIEGIKFRFILEGCKFFEDWDYDSERCIISSQDYNSIFSLDRPRHIIRWKKITNNF